MFTEWVTGMLFRPGATFARAEQELRFGYWWIVLSVTTLETVIGIFASPERAQLLARLDQTIFFYTMLFLALFTIQALLFRLACLVVAWPLTWADSLKYTGLLWSFLLLEDLITFQPALAGNNLFSTVGSGLVLVWYMIAIVAGLRQLRGVTGWRASGFAVVSSLAWPTFSFILHLRSLMG